MKFEVFQVRVYQDGPSYSDLVKVVDTPADAAAVVHYLLLQDSDDRIVVDRNGDD